MDAGHNWRGQLVYAEKIHQLGKLILETDEKVQFFDDSADVMELENTGRSIPSPLTLALSSCPAPYSTTIVAAMFPVTVGEQVTVN